MPKRHHSAEPVAAENECRSSAQGHPPKRSKSSSTSPSKDICKGVVRTHSKELVEILESVKDGRVSMEGGPPTSLTKLLRTMLSELDGIRQQNGMTSSEDGGNAGVLSSATSGEADVAPPADKIYDNEIRPLLPLTAWTLADIPKSHPPLPPILDPTQEKMAITHHGTREKSWQLSYENLEFLGDAFIYHVASEYISQTFPHLSPGRCSQVRERLLRNSNLSKYTLHYGLDKRAKLPDEFKGDGRSGGSRARDEQRQKVYGDLFEAYVGALIRSDARGVERAQQWLKPLWALTIEEDIRGEYLRRGEQQTAAKSSLVPATERDGRGDAPVAPIVPKLQLLNLIGCSAVKLRYEDAPGKPKKEKNSRLPLFAIDLWVDGWGKTECLGHGSGLSKKDAGSKAAQLAMLNKKALKFYIDKKDAYMAAREEQAARAAPGV